MNGYTIQELQTFQYKNISDIGKQRAVKYRPTNLERFFFLLHYLHVHQVGIHVNKKKASKLSERDKKHSILYQIIFYL